MKNMEGIKTTEDNKIIRLAKRFEEGDSLHNPEITGMRLEKYNGVSFEIFYDTGYEEIRNHEEYEEVEVPADFKGCTVEYYKDDNFQYIKFIGFSEEELQSKPPYPCIGSALSENMDTSGILLDADWNYHAILTMEQYLEQIVMGQEIIKVSELGDGVHTLREDYIVVIKDGEIKYETFGKLDSKPELVSNWEEYYKKGEYSMMFTDKLSRSLDGLSEEEKEKKIKEAHIRQRRERTFSGNQVISSKGHGIFETKLHW